MTLEEFLQTLGKAPQTVRFEDTLSVIDKYYRYVPVSFRNGSIQNGAGQNPASCKIFAFGKIHGLSELQTLNCFGDIYRTDVLGDPGGNNHQNIRQFMTTGWAGIHYDNNPLVPKRQ